MVGGEVEVVWLILALVAIFLLSLGFVFILRGRKGGGRKDDNNHEGKR